MTLTSHDHLHSIRAQMEKAARVATRNASDIALIAISKTQSVEAIRGLIAAGQRCFGENRVQEAQEKWPILIGENASLDLHLVGQLQSNKAQDAVALFSTIHSVDRLSLITALARAQDQLEKRPRCFLQVNIGDEPQKGGCAVGDIATMVKAARDAGLDVAGLMAVPPLQLEAAPYFALLAKIARDHGLEGLSMGMSSDFETAIMLGATHVRIGTALFGEREKGPG